MPPEPLYRADRQEPAYHLHYGWTCWPSSRRFVDLPSVDVLTSIADAWESDGLRALEWQWREDEIQITFSAKPHVSPVFLATRAKGRLQHALRTAGSPQDFSRKLAVRSIGDNCATEVEGYIASQVGKASFADGRFAEAMGELTFVDPSIDLATPIESARGRYWYNVHLVLVVDQRANISDRSTLRTIHDTCLRIAERKRYAIKAMSLMPDHLHLAVRGDIESSPQEIALAFQNNTAYALGQKPIWCETFYAGTFSEYDMGAVRPRSGAVAGQTASPSSKLDGVGVGKGQTG